MTRYKSLVTAMAALVAVGTVAPLTVFPAALAAEQTNGADDAAEFAKLNGAKLNLADAILAAEKEIGGKAVNAALDNEQTDAVFEVELMTADGSKSVSVDAMTGKVNPVDDDAKGENGGENDAE
jgi:uncharacterized membrane protein YkoI